MKRLLPFVLLAGAMSPSACAAPPALPLDDRQALIETLLERMTLAEKIGQLRLISIGGDMPRERIVEEIAAGRIGATFNSVTRADNRPMQEAALRSRLGIPIFFAYDVVHGHRTIFPISLALASSWDLDAIALSGRVSAIEASADGLDLTFAPMVDITRDPRWGRTSEGFGEDPYL
ncbi:MAG TPA: beta-glucosidase, partial [Pseudomonas sp.]|nr:beta-glucosidase [Pseudomonas sp.]